MKTTFFFALSRAFVVAQWIAWGILLIPIVVEGVKGFHSAVHPISECFKPISLEVGQGPAGVVVKYTRSIQCDMVGTYRVKVVPIGNGFPECDNSESIPYNRMQTGAPQTAIVLLERFVGEKCDLPPGRYKIIAHWTMKRSWAWDEDVEISSNEFTIEGKTS